MDYIKIRFGSDFDPSDTRSERSIEDFFRPRPVNPMFSSRECLWIPQMDIFETPDEVIVWSELAGVSKEDFEVEISSKAVRIFGIRKELPKGAEGTYRLAEIQFGKFERVLFMPAPVDTEIVTSTFSNGFLQIRIAKLRLDQTHKIPITDG